MQNIDDINVFFHNRELTVFTIPFNKKIAKQTHCDELSLFLLIQQLRVNLKNIINNVSTIREDRNKQG